MPSPSSPTSTRVVPDHVHELVGRAEGIRRPTRRARSARRPTPARSRVGAGPRRQGAVLPRSNLGRNTALAMGYTADDMRVWDPRHERGGLTGVECKESTFPVVERPLFGAPALPARARRRIPAEHPDGIVIAHPECSAELCAVADQVGSTDYIIRAVNDAPDGSAIAVRHGRSTSCRSRQRDPGQQDDRVTRPAHLPVLDEVPHRRHISVGAREPRRRHVVNRITVDSETSEWARVALQRMLDITETAAPRLNPIQPPRTATNRCRRTDPRRADVVGGAALHATPAKP